MTSYQSKNIVKNLKELGFHKVPGDDADTNCYTFQVLRKVLNVVQPPGIESLSECYPNYHLKCCDDGDSPERKVGPEQIRTK